MFRPYVDPIGHNAILAVWTGHLDHHIWFEQGQTFADGTITWTKAAVLPSTVQFTNTTAGPTVLFTNHVYRVILSWRGPANHVRFTVGTPVGRGFNWSNSAIIPGPSVTSTCKGAPAPPTPRPWPSSRSTPPPERSTSSGGSWHHQHHLQHDR